MKKIRAAVVGYGNIGHYALQALEAAPDFEVAGIVRRNGAENKPEELARYDVVKDIRELQDVDVAILATPTRSVEKYAKEILALGINTVDSFDIHPQITSLRRSLDESAKAGKAVRTPDGLPDSSRKDLPTANDAKHMRRQMASRYAKPFNQAAPRTIVFLCFPPKPLALCFF